MADSERVHHQPDGDHLLAGEATSFSELLFSNDDGDGDVVGLAGMDHHLPTSFHYSSTDEKPPKMLCFGGYDGDDQNDGRVVLFSDATRVTPQKSGVTCSDSSSASSANNNNNNNVANVNTVPKPNRKRNVPKQEPVVQCANAIEPTPWALASERTSKKTKVENPTSISRAKVRREKLGDRITALQQLVSPFGKTDTASVLHEAMGYIRFLQDQVQVLCSPYLQDLPEGEVNRGEQPRKDLRSRGLCLVPVDCTVHVASSNGADYWSPAATGNDFSSNKQQ